jgi:hypothetical protein
MTGELQDINTSQMGPMNTGVKMLLQKVTENKSSEIRND